MTRETRKTTCPTCGGAVRVVSSDEGTSYYEPAPTATYPCIWCGTPLDECGDPPCCPENDHPYRTAQETIAAIRADALRDGDA